MTRSATFIMFTRSPVLGTIEPARGAATHVHQFQLVLYEIATISAQRGQVPLEVAQALHEAHVLECCAKSQSGDWHRGVGGTWNKDAVQAYYQEENLSAERP
jgi:hypothetical protein